MSELQDDEEKETLREDLDLLNKEIEDMEMEYDSMSGMIEKLQKVLHTYMYIYIYI
jgi:hypothetical protein